MALFARLYPRGDRARHFQQLLERYLPQTSAATPPRWACLVHNEVNKRLGKPEFDCTKLDLRLRLRRGREGREGREGEGEGGWGI